jgi:hypothetical protein
MRGRGVSCPELRQERDSGDGVRSGGARAPWTAYDAAVLAMWVCVVAVSGLNIVRPTGTTWHVLRIVVGSLTLVAVAIWAALWWRRRRSR